MNSKNLPVQADIDERDLRCVVVGTYAYGGLIGLATLVSLFFSLGGGINSFFFFSIIPLIGGMLYAWANVESARAIAARDASHFSFLVAGMNIMAFPFGTILGILTWRVLCRPSIREIYADPFRVPSLPPLAQQFGSKPKPKPVQLDIDAHLTHIDDAEEALWREMEKEHKERKASEIRDKIKPKPADD